MVLSEKELTYRHSSGVQIHGYPDQVKKVGDQHVVVDYKTGATVKHTEDDIDTCLQVVMYAYLLEAHGMKVSHCEYHYPRINMVVQCRYDADMKEKLNEKMQMFKKALETGEYPCATDDEKCEYCTLGNICGRVAKEGETE